MASEEAHMICIVYLVLLSTQPLESKFERSLHKQRRNNVSRSSGCSARGQAVGQACVLSAVPSAGHRGYNCHLCLLRQREPSWLYHLDSQLHSRASAEYVGRPEVRSQLAAS